MGMVPRLIDEDSEKVIIAPMDGHFTTSSSIRAAVIYLTLLQGAKKRGKSCIRT
jgi:hypothetical protein